MKAIVTVSEDNPLAECKDILISNKKNSPDFKRGFKCAIKMILAWYTPEITIEEFKSMLDGSLLLQEQMEKQEASDAKI